MKKTILFGCPDLFGMHSAILEELKKMNFEVVDISTTTKLHNKTFLEKVQLFVSLKLFKSRVFEEELYQKKKTEALMLAFEGVFEKKYDYCLLIRPDIYPVEILKKIRSISTQLVAYQWDGIDRFSAVFNLIFFFDKFYVFDTNDYKKYINKYKNLHFTTNFYIPNLLNKKQLKEVEVYYLGSYHKKRINTIYSVCDKLFEVGVRKFKVIINDRGKNLKSLNENLSFTPKVMSYERNLQEVPKAKVLLDFKLAEHNGLSFRFFEALYYECKIITNNPSVLDYDFYKSKNIFIMGVDDWSDLSDFIAQPYEKINQELIDKYAFSNWLTTILS